MLRLCPPPSSLLALLGILSEALSYWGIFATLVNDPQCRSPCLLGTNVE